MQIFYFPRHLSTASRRIPSTLLLEKVHIPVINVQNPFRRAAINFPLRGQGAKDRPWAWMVTAIGVAIVLGAWVITTYFNKNPLTYSE